MIEPQLDQTPSVTQNIPTSMGGIKPLDFSTATQTNTNSMKKLPIATIVVLLFAVFAGVGTGYGFNKIGKSGSAALGTAGPIQQVATTGNIKDGDVFGSADESTFKDSAEGYIKAGGIEGEGSHQLVRPGGETQTVYLTSSVTDMDKFVGMEVKVWGETFKGQKAGWLMDVGRVQILKSQGVEPTEE